MNNYCKNKSSTVFVQKTAKNTKNSDLKKAIEKVFVASTNNLSWLKKGDKVLLKPALNSPDPYPSTTHPLAIEVITDILQKRGAQVFVGDQSGVEHVVHNKSGIVRGSSRDCFIKSGIGKNKKYNFIAFEEGDWDRDFIHIENAKTTAWPDGFYVTRWIDKVDHIINLPRLSTHLQAGVTLGFKNFVGILREDSRYVFHLNGPFNAFVPGFFREARFSHKDDGTNQFFEKIAQISLAVKDKLRLTLFVGTQAQVTVGPDRKTVTFLPAKVVTPDTGYIFASDDQVSAEAFAIKTLTDIYLAHAGNAKYLQKFLLFINGQAKELNRSNIYENPFIVCGEKFGLGNKKYQIKNIK